MSTRRVRETALKVRRTALLSRLGRIARRTALLSRRGRVWRPILPLLLVALAGAQPVTKPTVKPTAKPSAKPATPQPQPNHCVDCHSTSELWSGDQLKFYVTAEDFDGDIHWAKGLRCPDCHGGNPATNESIAAAHAGFRPAATHLDIVELCGNCHADIDFMRRYNPSPRVDQLREYWTSGHGRRLKKENDLEVATCVSCHGKPHGNALDKAKHGVLPVKEPDSPVFPTNVAKTCARCHADAKIMGGRTYHGKPIGHDQYELWRQSVHAEALLKKGELSAATCNSCHGNHGAVPPQVNSVANACGLCHVKNAELFNQTVMRHGFQKVGLPGCVTCHSNHKILRPSVQMLGMQQGAVCVQCHAKGKYGATLAGAEVARKLRADLSGFRDRIQHAQATIAQAERLGMEVSGPRYDLRKATDALLRARVEIHSFAVAPVEQILDGGEKTVVAVQAAADGALKQYHDRRIWLAVSLVPIVAIILLLVLHIRTESPPAPPPPTQSPEGEQSRRADRTQ